MQFDQPENSYELFHLKKIINLINFKQANIS